MPIKTNLNRYPYWDDYDEKKDFYKVLFKPGVSVQMRELNQLQTLLQTQIERFGDNIVQQGTIVSGCNFQFHTPYPFIKIPDVQTDGALTVPSNYLGKFVYDPVSGLRAYVVNYLDGYELSDPDLKTLYITYVNSGVSGSQASFNPGNNVTIYDGSYPISEIEVVNGGTGFSNADQVVISPAMLINVVTGSFTVSDNIVNPITGANVEILTIDTTTVSGRTIVTTKPLDDDLTNSSVNSAAWSFELYDAVTNPIGSTAGMIEKIYGGDALGRVVTDATGAVQRIDILGGGKAYTETPSATIKTSNASAVISNLILTPRNFIAKVRIPNTGTAVGNGYAFGISEGTIYQHGYFLRVEPQTAIIAKYTSSPNNAAVGFSTVETIIDAQADETLYENALGTPNEFAPGADRLRMFPELLVLTKEAAAANESFFTLVEWNDGFPYKQNRVTEYSRLGDTLGDMIYDSSGNFVLDAFQVTTETVANTAMEGTHYTAVIDPGQAYINGRKVQTLSNYKIDMTKGLDTKLSNNVISINYGNYVRVNNLAGNFDFSAGATVDLYDKPVEYMSNTSVVTTGTIAPNGANIGTARIRSLELESGYPGTISAAYRLYLFDIHMNAGQNFRNVKSLYYNGTYKGIADIILTFDATTSSNVAQLKDTGINSLLFSSGVESLKNSNTSNYIYRTVASTNTDIATAAITLTLNDPNEFFPYEGDLALSQMQELTVVPVEASIKCINATGTVAVNTTSNTVTGTSTSFGDYYYIGDYFEATDGAANVNIRRVTGIVNSTALLVDKPFLFTTSGLKHRRIFPKNLPIPFGQRPGLYANVDGTEQVLTIAFKHANGIIMSLDYAQADLDTQVAYNVERRNVSAATKTANRNVYVKIRMANNAAGVSGPWSLGVPDALRLRGVYQGNSTVNANSSDVTNHFYIDSNQNANYLGLSYLFRNPQSRLTINTSDYLLVCFDYFTRDNAGYYDTVSYLRTANAELIALMDSKTFDELRQSDAACSWEVPEVYTSDGKYYDLHSTFDFRPAAANTVLPHSAVISAPTNPSETITLAPTKFPRPNATMRTQVEQYLGRIDDIYIAENGSIFILKGIPDVNTRMRYQSNHPKDCLRLQVLVVPPYPNLAKALRNSTQAIIRTGISNEKYLNLRLKTHTISQLLSSINLQTSQPMVYTMEDIASLERRIKDLEYYVSLSVLETSLTNKIIPSSINPALDRFKFGFFADDFSTEIYCDVDNPQYAASIETEGSGDFAFGTDKNPFGPSITATSADPELASIPQPSKIILSTTNRLVPLKYVWSLKHFTENTFYIDEFVISQDNATTKLIVPPPTPNTPNPPPVPPPCVVVIDANNAIPGNAYYTSINRRVSTVYLENLPGIVNIYFHILSESNTTSVGAKIDVFNANNTLIASTDVAHNNVTQLSAADITFLSTNPLANSFYKSLVVSNLNTGFTRLSNTINQDLGTGVGKIRLTTQGGGKIVVQTTSTALNWKYLVEFPSIYAAQKNIVNTPQCDPNPPVYKGTMAAGELTIIQWSCSNIFRVNATGYKAFILKGTGLKPNTVHKFYMDGEWWPEVILYTQARLAEAFDADLRSDMRSAGSGSVPGDTSDYGSGSTRLVLNATDKVNEAARYLTMSMNRLYNADGSPSPYTVLTTDKYGKVTFLVFFPLNIAGWFSQDFNAPSYALNYTGYGSKSGYGDVSASQTGYGLYLSPTLGSSGYTSLVLQSDDGTSLASRVFANRTPNKTIPNDPLGNI